MPPSDTTRRAHRFGPGLKPLGVLLLLILLPAAIFGIRLVGQMDEIRRHNLERLDRAADAMSSLLENARTTMGSLNRDRAYACMFFQRQVRLELREPDCTELTNVATDPDALTLRIRNGELELVGEAGLRVRVRLDVIAGEIPFGNAFDQLLIVDPSGRLLGPGIAPGRHSPLEPPGVAVEAPPSPIRVVDLSTLAFAERSGDAAPEFASIENATFVRGVEVAGLEYELMCQPLRFPLGDGDTAEGAGESAEGGARTQSWRLCGLVDSRRSFQQALEVAPHVVMVLLVLVTIAIVSWPVLKALSLSPRERIRFVDLYLILVATLALVMLLVVGIADSATYWALRERSAQRLRDVASDLDARLRHELELMYEQLTIYDRALVEQQRRESLRNVARTASSGAIASGCLHLSGEARRANPACQAESPQPAAPPLLPAPTVYPWMESVYWMRPCDGLQFLKASALERNTPAVPLSRRNYFQAVKMDRLWAVPIADGAGDAPARYYVETSASITTGVFFAAISTASALGGDGPPLFDGGGAPASWRDCQTPEDARFAVALTAQPASVKYPVLGPGVGFAVVDPSGLAVFHSDERRAVYENLLQDTGLGNRLRAALAARATADIYAHYQTRPHQVHVRPMAGLPWSVVTFADDEVIRTWHIELVARTIALLGVYLLAAVLGTLVYMLLHGRAPPRWVWPRHDPMYRELYGWTIWSLLAQLVVFLLAIDALSGGALAIASVALPAPALATVVLASRRAAQLARTAHADPDGPAHAIRDAHRRTCAAALAVSMAIAVVIVAAMSALDPVSARQTQVGASGAALLIVLVVLMVAPLRVLRRPEAEARGAAGGPRVWRRLDAPALHVLGTTLIWLSLGALPAYGLYAFALSSQMTSAARQEQVYLARALRWRACGIQDDYRLVPTGSGLDARALRLQLAGVTGASGAGEPPVSDVYPRAFLSRAIDVAPPETAPLSDGLTAAVERTLYGMLRRVAPVYNETTVHLRYLDPVAAVTESPSAGATWSWRDAADGSAVMYYQHPDPAPCDPALAGPLAAAPAIREPQIGWPGRMGLFVFLLVLVAWVSYGVRRIFFGDVEADARPDGARLDDGRTLERYPAELGTAPDAVWGASETAVLEGTVTQEQLDEWCRTYTTRRAVIDRILDRARAHYEALWQRCSMDERFVLVQLVEEGIANPKQTEVVRSLLARGLLTRDPALRPMNHSFAMFVEQRADHDAVHAWEHPAEGLRWSRVRTVLLAALALVLVFLSVTQPGVMEVWVAYLGTAAAGVAGLIRLFSLVSRPGAKGAPE